jgi:hypothetical protein
MGVKQNCRRYVTWLGLANPQVKESRELLDAATVLSTFLLDEALSALSDCGCKYTTP